MYALKYGNTTVMDALLETGLVDLTTATKVVLISVCDVCSPHLHNVYLCVTEGTKCVPHSSKNAAT